MNPCYAMFLRCNKWRQSRQVLPNVSSFVQSVYSLMMSSKLVEVQCEAAALLVELTAAPKILEEVEKCYMRLLSDRNMDDVLRKIIHERLKTVREKIPALKNKQKKRAKIPIIVL